MSPFHCSYWLGGFQFGMGVLKTFADWVLGKGVFTSLGQMLMYEAVRFGGKHIFNSLRQCHHFLRARCAVCGGAETVGCVPL